MEFEFFVGKRLIQGIFLGMVDLLFLMVLGDFLRSNTFQCIPELVPSRVLGLVAGFHHDMDFRFCSG